MTIVRHGNLLRSEPPFDGRERPAGTRPHAARRQRPDGLGEFRVLGLNWQTATLDERDAAALRTRSHPVALPGVDGTACREAVLLSTCNRLELYALCPGELARDPLGARYFEGVAPSHLYELSGSEAASHLFAVTAGLQSMVLGETEIFSQVKEAYSRAVAASGTGQVLNRLFHGAFAVSKQVRTTTEIGRGNTSYASAAYHICRRLMPGDTPINVLLLGAGEIAATVADFFHQQKETRLTVLSRRESRARELAERYGCAGHRALADWPALLPGADVIIGGLAVDAPFLDADNLAPLLAGRTGRKLLLIDLSIPRNFCCRLAEHPGVELVNINDLKEIIERSLERRQEAVRRSEPLLRAEVARVETWSQGGSAAAVMNRLAERVRTVAVGCLVAGLPGVLEIEMAELKLLHRALMKLLMHAPRTVLDRWPEADRAVCYERLGKVFCPETPADRRAAEAPSEEGAELFRSPGLARGVRLRFLNFLERIGGYADAEELADRLAEPFVRQLLAPVNRAAAAATCDGNKRAIARDVSLFIPD